MILYGGVERWKILKIAEEGWLHFMSIASVKELVFFQLGILFGFCLLLFIIVNWARINWLLPLAVMVIFEGVLFTRMQMTVTVSADRQSAEVSRGMQDAPEGFPTPTMDPLTDFSDSILSRKHTVLWKNLAMLQKRPSCDGVSPYSLKTTELAAEKGYLEKMVQLPYVFTFEGFSEYREIHWNTIDYLNEQGLTIKKFNPNETELIIKASKSDGKRYVCLNQNWYPYWEAKVDGKSTEILRVNKSFIAIEVPKKASKLSFKFNPVSYRGLAQLSFALFVILLGVLCALSLKKILPTRS